MKKNYFKTLVTSVFLLSLLFTGYSCTSSPTRDYLDEFEIRRIIQEELRKNNQDLEFTQWEIINISIKQQDWQWNENAAQFEAVVDLPELTKFIYEKGANLGYVFIGEQGKDEVQKMLPYVNTYSADNSTFTETISFDIQFGNPSTVAFFIKSSDLYKDPEAPQNYNFRIVLIW